MISFQKRFLFVHIPKTAGNSIQSILRDYSEDEIVALRAEQDGIERFGLRNPNYKIKNTQRLRNIALHWVKRGSAIFTSLPVSEIHGTVWSRTISGLHNSWKPGNGRNLESLS